MAAKCFHVIGNSHMDPVWLWRLREGRSTWLNTCRSVVNMMEKHRFLKFCRSSTDAYKWVEDADPRLFARIKALVEEGRWELVGGWVEQSDTIITAGESLLRQAEAGNAYFREKFGRAANIAYSVDSFGQNAGLPKILNAGGFDRYVWMRPMDHEKKMPHLFRWQGDDARSELLCLRVRNAYCTWMGMTRREEMFRLLDSIAAEGDEEQAFFFGVGDHGGGIYERQIEWLQEYAQNFEVRYSTLAEYFDIVAKQDLPVVRGEHTHHAPGCYSAVGAVKKWVKRAERNLYKAEKLAAEGAMRGAAAPLRDAWERLLFFYFHDVFSGTSNAASYDEEVRDGVGAANLAAVDVIERGLGVYASRARTDFLTEGGMLAWNPLPFPTRAVIALDTFGDPNASGRNFDALVDASGREIPLQWFRGAAAFGPGGSWGRATAVVDLDASGLAVFAYARSANPDASRLGFDRQRAWAKRLSFDILADEGDTWGHDLKRLGNTLGSAALESKEEMENGAVGSRMRLRFAWKNSRFSVDLFAWRGIGEIEARVRGDWREIGETLKLALDTQIDGGAIYSGQAACALERVPDDCEQPFIDWAAAAGGGKIAGVLAESLHGYDTLGARKLRVTANRPVAYVNHVPNKPHGDEGFADIGFFEQKLWLFEDSATDDAASFGSQLARKRLWTPEQMEITAASDGAGFERDAWSVEPPQIETLSQRVGADGAIVLDLLNTTAREQSWRILRNGACVATGTLPPNALRQVSVVRC